MPINKGFDTGVSTINENIQDLLSRKNYPPSYMARIINRAIEDKRYKRYVDKEGVRKGHFLENPSAFHYMLDRDGVIENEDRKLHYPNLTLVGFEGPKIMTALDDLVEEHDLTTLKGESFYNMMAMMVVAIGTAHVFPDGDGRAAIGLADACIRKHLHKKLSLALLQKEDDKLTKLMAIGSLCMLPEEYNPNTLIEDVPKGSTRKVLIPNPQTHTVRQTQKFTWEYAMNVVDTLAKFNPTNLLEPNSLTLGLYTDSIRPLAKLLQSSTIT